MRKQPVPVHGLADLAAVNDLFLIDQFGVLHDGIKPYPGAVEALTTLVRMGKGVVILTNSGRRADANTARLVRLGFPPESFTRVVSSGEVSWHGILDGRFGAAFRPGLRAYVVGRPGEDYGLDGLRLTLVSRAEEADFVLISGTDAPHTSLDQYREMLRKAAAAKIPALCANPDRQMLTTHGLEAAPGAIAEVYESLGGAVVYTGKPSAEIYRFALAQVPNCDRSRVLAVGDSVEHDIAGALRVGLRSALVRTGILADVNESELHRLFEKYEVWPDFIMGGIVW